MGRQRAHQIPRGRRRRAGECTGGIPRPAAGQELRQDAGQTGGASIRRTTMKAAFIEQYGGPEVLKYGDLPDPVAGPGEVVIDVVAASVNGADWKVSVGQYKQAEFPFALGRDFSGVVSAVGEIGRAHV